MRASARMRVVGPGGNLNTLSRPQPELGIMWHRTEIRLKWEAG